MAKADLNINVTVSGAEKAEKQLEDVGKSARKAGDGAKKGGKEFKELGKGIGDVSENMDKRLEDSVGRSFKGFDRLTSIIGQATGALALVTGGVALLKVGYDKLIKPQLESTKLFKEQQRALANLADRVRDIRSAYDDLTASIGVNIEELERADVARLASNSKVIRELSEQLPKLTADLEAAEKELEAARDKAAQARAARGGANVMGIQEFHKANLAAAESAEKAAIASISRLEEQRASVVAGLRRQRGILNRLRDEIKEIFADVGPEAPEVGRPTAPPRAPRRGRARESAIEQFEAGLAAETEAENRAVGNRQALRASADAVDLARADEAAAAREQLAKESRARLLERERIDRASRIALIENEDERELALVRARHREEFSAATKANADLIALKRAQQKEIDGIEEAAAARRRQRQQENVQRTITSASAVAAALGAGAKAFGLGVGVEMFAQGLQDVGTAASEGSKAAARFAVFDVVGGAAHTLAAGLATAAAVKNFAGATQLGKGGGSAGGAPVAIPAPPPRRGDIGEGEGGERVTNINVTFTGRSFVTQREIREDVAGILGSRGRGGRAVTA